MPARGRVCSTRIQRADLNCFPAEEMVRLDNPNLRPTSLIVVRPRSSLATCEGGGNGDVQETTIDEAHTSFMFRTCTIHRSLPAPRRCHRTTATATTTTTTTTTRRHSTPACGSACHVCRRGGPLLRSARQGLRRKPSDAESTKNQEAYYL